MRKVTGDLLRQAFIVTAASAAFLAAGFGCPYVRDQLTPAAARVAAPIRAHAASFPSAPICLAPIRPWGALLAQAQDVGNQTRPPVCASTAPSLPRALEPAARAKTDLALAR